MEIKELEKMLKMCRKQGVTELTIDGLSFKLGELPKDGKGDITEAPGFPQDELTPEQLMYYSAGGDPANDPELNQ